MADFTIKDSENKEIQLPLSFEPREAKHLFLTWEFPVKGTADEKILQDHIEIIAGSKYYKQKYEYEICTEDINENIFDCSGRQINLQELNLRWTLPNTMRELQDGKSSPFLKHYFCIFKAKIKFWFKIILHTFGL